MTPRLQVPPLLVASHRTFFGDAGRSWIEALPGMAADVLQRWSLRPDGPDRHGAVAWVLPVRDAQDRPGVLKLQPVDTETAGEPAALRAWNGNGAVRLLRHDPITGSMLLERADAGRTLSVLPDRAAVQLVAELLARLTRIQAPAGLRQLADIGADLLHRASLVLDRSATGRLSDPLLRTMISRCAGAFAEVLTEPGDRLLHWDLHYDNVLAALPDSGREPWLAIDPKPLAGDPGFEVLPALHNRWDALLNAADLNRAVLRRFELITEVVGLDPRRAAGWTLGRVLDNLLWEIETGQSSELAARDRVIADVLLAGRAK